MKPKQNKGIRHVQPLALVPLYIAETMSPQGDPGLLPNPLVIVLCLRLVSLHRDKPKYLFSRSIFCCVE